MATFDITQVPQQVFLGDQPQVTLVNDGPYSCFLSENTQVDSLNGFELPPTGQMTWKTSRPLFAAVRRFVQQSGGIDTVAAVPQDFNPIARLRTSVAGELSLTTRAKFFKPIFKGPPFSGDGNMLLETGHCNTIMVTYRFPTGANFLSNPLLCQFYWYDEDLNCVTIESYFADVSTTAFPEGMSIPGLRIQSPVHGKYLNIQCSTGIVPSTSLTVVGTDAILLSKHDAGSGSVGFVGTLLDRGSYIRFVGWTAGEIHFPMRGGSLVRIHASNPGAACVLTVTCTSTDRFTQFNVPAGGDAGVQFNVPVDLNYVVALTGAGNLSGSISWPVDLVNG